MQKTAGREDSFEYCFFLVCAKMCKKTAGHLVDSLCVLVKCSSFALEADNDLLQKHVGL